MGVDILVLGGTRFIGRHFVSAALAGGHRVTLFHRGRSGADLFPEAVHLLGDRDGDLAALGTGSWDATVDFSAYLPRHVRELHAVLGGRGGRYLLVSSTAAYAAGQQVGFTEDAPLAALADEASEEVTAETYGGLKALCERAAREVAGDCLIVRPTYVVGPLDYSGAFAYWVNRLAAGGEVLAPGPADEPFQWIDARDLTSWMLALLEADRRGVLHAAGPWPPRGFGAFLDEIAAAVAGPDLRLTWVERDFLLARDLDGDQLPMWPGANPAGVVEGLDPSRAVCAGLTTRPLRETAADVLAFERAEAEAGDEPVAIGIDRDKERALLDEWHASRPAPS